MCLDEVWAPGQPDATELLKCSTGIQHLVFVPVATLWFVWVGPVRFVYPLLLLDPVLFSFLLVVTLSIYTQGIHLPNT